LCPPFVPLRFVALAVRRAFSFSPTDHLPADQTYLPSPPFPLRRRPPQSNYPPYTVSDPDNEPGLEPQSCQGGISRMAPRELASTLQSLPPILHKQLQSPAQSYSKGSRGLSVLPRRPE